MKKSLEYDEVNNKLFCTQCGHQYSMYGYVFKECTCWCHKVNEM
jgi:hypothetical protein